MANLSSTNIWEDKEYHVALNGLTIPELNSNGLIIRSWHGVTVGSLDSGISCAGFDSQHSRDYINAGYLIIRGGVCKSVCNLIRN